MSDPKRLLEGAGTSPELASLLRALPKPEPPTAAQEADLVRRMMAPLPAPVAPVSASHAATWWLGALVAVAIVGGAWLALRPAAAPAEAPVAPPRAPTAVVTTAPVAEIPAVPSPVVVERAPPTAPVAPKRAAAADTLAEEAELLEKARRALSSGPGAALALLRQHEARFPNGQLAAERSFLTVQALERSGDRAGGSRSAELLMKRYPRSVYATQVRQRYGSAAPQKD